MFISYKVSSKSLAIIIRLLDVLIYIILYGKMFIRQKSSICLIKIAEFNYKLLNNIPSCNLYLSKWKNDRNMMCDHCEICIENIRHLIYDCKNIRTIWHKLSMVMNFDIKWKNVLLGFYHEENRKISLFNTILSFVAYRIYKYKLWCRLENIPETEFNITYNVKQTLTTFCKVLKRCRPEWNLRVIHLFVNILL